MNMRAIVVASTCLMIQEVLDAIRAKGAEPTYLAEQSAYGVTALVARLKEGVVHFWYTKSDGSMREAFGTQAEHLIPKYKTADVEKLLETAEAVKGNMQSILGGSDGYKTDADPFNVNVDQLRGAMQPFMPKEKKEQKPSEWVNYFDVGTGDWRKFHPANVVFFI